jgi:peptidyl-prolyl cis-trans isomerase A (cyclophilin A)
MKKLIGTILALLFFANVYSQKVKNPVVLIETRFGNIKVELYKDKAPISVNNFLKYVDKGLYKNSSFYRTVKMDNQPNNKIKIEVIQGGLGDNPAAVGLPPIKHESTKETRILHRDGVISYARNAPGTESSEFFICIGDQPKLNYGGMRNPDGQGFAAFGRVIKGMNIVRKIQLQPSVGQALKPAIKIYNIVRAKQ